MTLISLIDEISPKDQKSRNQLGVVREYITEHAEDEDYVPVEDTDSSDEESEGEPEEVMIDRTDPNFLAIH